MIRHWPWPSRTPSKKHIKIYSIREMKRKSSKNIIEKEARAHNEDKSGVCERDNKRRPQVRDEGLTLDGVAGKPSRLHLSLGMFSYS
jgi:hypothetical protein